MKNLLAVGSVIAALAASSGDADAWGHLGHEIVCEIAFQELNSAARREVKKLIRADNEFRTFAKSCTWPDNPRQRRAEHFVNVARDATDFGGLPCPTTSRCVVKAILGDTRDLAISTDINDQLEALKFLGHFVGDLHQPMHVSFFDDKGANKIRTNGVCDSSLHAVWDTCMVKEAIGREARTVAAQLISEISQDDRDAWFPDSIRTETVIGWAEESFKITLSPESEYCEMQGGTCRYDSGSAEFDGSNQKIVTVNQDYMAHNGPIVRDRLKMAGVRLGGILNTVFEDPDAEADSLAAIMTERDAGAHRSTAQPDLAQIAELMRRIEELEARIRVLEGD